MYVEPTGGESHSFNYCYEQGVKAFSFGHKKETKTGLFVGVFISMFIRCYSLTGLKVSELRGENWKYANIVL